jgi:hypothetical protein
MINRYVLPPCRVVTQRRMSTRRRAPPATRRLRMYVREGPCVSVQNRTSAPIRPDSKTRLGGRASIVLCGMCPNRDQGRP